MEANTPNYKVGDKYIQVRFNRNNEPRDVTVTIKEVVQIPHKDNMFPTSFPDGEYYILDDGRCVVRGNLFIK